MKEFHTRGIANEGVKLPLYLPTGKASEHALTVVGIDSDIFREADKKAKRKVLEFSKIANEQKRAEAARELELELIASLVIGWTFEEDCNLINVVNFLREAPQIADAINRFAADRASFFAKKSNSLSTGSKEKSSSKAHARKTRKSRLGRI